MEQRDKAFPEVEHRRLKRKIELRKTEQGTYMEGYAAVFYDVNNLDATQFRLWSNTYERVMPGAFNNAIARPDDVRCLFNHDESDIYGRTAANTLVLTVDNIGLRFSCLLDPDSDDATELLTSIKRGDVDACSFGFRADAVTWRDVGENSYRELTDVTLYDVGPVTFPAYTGTSVDIAKRSRTDFLEEQARIAEETRDAAQRRIRLSRLKD
ncbi:MAG: HK97 family phage prohead protease [Planctomycetes bacterium]|nr:HK97 family phage prohead protease [Planctomycetota bacterium]